MKWILVTMVVASGQWSMVSWKGKKSNLPTNRISTNKTRCWFTVQVQRFAKKLSVLLIEKAFPGATLNHIWWKSEIADENFTVFHILNLINLNKLSFRSLFNGIQTVHCSFFPAFVYFDEFVYIPKSSGGRISVRTIGNTEQIVIKKTITQKYLYLSS